MKICLSCKKQLPIDSFGINNARKDKKHYYCKTCKSLQEKKSYYKNWDKNKKLINKHNKVRKRRNKLLVLEYLTKHSCVDCGEKDLRVLEFDHVRGQKFKGISVLFQGTYSIEKILKEISKCDVVCANCHKKRTHDRIGSWRSKYLEDSFKGQDAILIQSI